MHVVDTPNRPQSSLESEPSHLNSNYNASSINLLSPLQQLTVSTWRLAATKVARTLDPFAVLDHAALHAVIGALRQVDQPLALFPHHATADAELSLITSLIGATCRSGLAYDILDAAYLVRWNELIASSTAAEGLPPLRSGPTATDLHAENG